MCELLTFRVFSIVCRPERLFSDHTMCGPQNTDVWMSIEGGVNKADLSWKFLFLYKILDVFIRF